MSVTALAQPIVSKTDDVIIDIVRMNGADSIHKAAFGQQFREIIHYEADLFGAAFNSKDFSRVIDAVRAGKAQAYFLLAGTQKCHPHFIGASIQFMSVITKWNGQDFDYYAAPYFEDICVSSQLLANFIRATDAKFPKGPGLGSRFMQEMIKSSISNTYGDTPAEISGRGFIGEYAPDGKQIIRILNELQSTLGHEGQSAILELQDFTLGLDLGSEIHSLSAISNEGDTEKLSNIFAVSWANEKAGQQISASFTEAISSFSGETILRVQFTTNGRLPSQDILTEVVRSLLTEGQFEAVNRGWSVGDMDCDYIKMRIHVMNEPEIIMSLKAIGATERLLGERPMLPLITDFADMPQNMIAGLELKDRPLLVKRETTRIGDAFTTPPSNKEILVA